MVMAKGLLSYAEKSGSWVGDVARGSGSAVPGDDDLVVVPLLDVAEVGDDRERFLTPEEIGRLAKALDAAKDQRAAGIIRLCMLTGARSGEVRQARFEQFNLDLGSWSKPAATTKQRKIHRIPISPF